VASAYITDITDESERTRWMGMLGASFAVGFLLGPAIGGLLSPYGHEVPMLAAAGLAAVNFAYALFVLKEPASHAEEESGPSRAEVLADPRVRRICWVYLTYSLAVTQLETIFAFLMMDSFDYDAREVAFVLVAMAVVMGAIQGGGMRVLAARFGERKLMLWGAGLMAVSFAAIPWPDHVSVLIGVLVVSAVGRGICQPAMLSMASSYATPATRGAVMGTFQSRAALARFLGPAPAGLLYAQFAASPFLLAAALLVLALVLGTRLPERVGEDASSPGA
jgi:DHA1 family tetracycline resistance protein-like MFS transporter